MPSQWLIGLEADLQGSAIKGTTSQTQTPAFLDSTTTSVTKSIDWFGTVRGRVGYLITPTLLLYGTGGFAYGGVDAFQQSSTFTGWTAGGGVEWLFAPHWSAKAEYLYVNLTSSGNNGGGSLWQVSNNIHPQINVVRVGVNYHFNWTGPVVAKY